MTSLKYSVLVYVLCMVSPCCSARQGLCAHLVDDGVCDTLRSISFPSFLQSRGGTSWKRNALLEVGCGESDNNRVPCIVPAKPS